MRASRRDVVTQWRDTERLQSPHPTADWSRCVGLGVSTEHRGARGEPGDVAEQGEALAAVLAGDPTR